MLSIWMSNINRKVVYDEDKVAVLTKDGKAYYSLNRIRSSNEEVSVRCTPEIGVTYTWLLPHYGTFRFERGNLQPIACSTSNVFNLPPGFSLDEHLLEGGDEWDCAGFSMDEWEQMHMEEGERMWCAHKDVIDSGMHVSWCKKCGHKMYWDRMEQAWKADRKWAKDAVTDRDEFSFHPYKETD